jgi:hypothetical protein
MPRSSTAPRLPARCEKMTLTYWAGSSVNYPISGFARPFGVNHRLTSNTATAQQNMTAQAEFKIRVRIIGFLHVPRPRILDVR